MKNHTNPSQTVKILNYLLKGKSLTPLEALSRFKCFRLASRINEINRSGFKVEKEMVNKNGKRYAKYFLKKKIAQALAVITTILTVNLNAQDSVSYNSYSYRNGFDENAPIITYGTATIEKNKSSQEKLIEVYDQIIERGRRRNEEIYQKINQNRKMRELEDQTKELKRQTEILKNIANQ